MFQDQPANAHRQFESPRPSTPRIEIEHAFACLLFRDMTMAADHNRESRRFRLEVQLNQIVQNVNGNAAHLEHLGFRERAGPRPFVDIAEHRCDGGNCRKLFEDLGRADIPGVDDVFRSAQRFDGLKTQQTVGV